MKDTVAKLEIALNVVLGNCKSKIRVKAYDKLERYLKDMRKVNHDASGRKYFMNIKNNPEISYLLTGKIGKIYIV